MASERVFSDAGLFDTLLRSMLGDEIFEDLVIISHNMPRDVTVFLKSLEAVAKLDPSIGKLSTKVADSFDDDGSDSE